MEKISSQPKNAHARSGLPEEFSLLMNLPAAIYLCDMEGRITFYNDAAAALWGRRPEIGKDLWCGSWKIFTPEGEPMLADACPMAVTLREGRAVTGEEILVERPDGTRINVRPYPEPIYDASGKMCGARNMLVDITDIKEKETQLQESDAKYRALSESLERTVAKRTQTLKKSEERYHKMVEEVQDYAILLLDVNGNILNWNKGAQNIKGYTEKEIIGKNFSTFYLKEDRDDNLPQKLIHLARTTGKAMHEGWRLRKDGTTFWGYIVITALHDESGEVIGFSKVTRDLTERKLAEDKLREYAHDIEFRNKQLEEFAYIASHDLQEPLRKILTFGDLLMLKINDKEAVANYIERINASANRMSVLIKDVLQYSRLMEQDDLYQETDLNLVLQEVKEDFELLIAEKKASVKASKLPIIRGIPIQLHQLFSNLISNSIKFSEKAPKIEITSEYVSGKSLKRYAMLNKSHSYIKLDFKDNGSGFEQQYAGQVFKLFKRLHNAQSGTGIGLALCKKIAENHYGDITVSSETGKGTVFSVFLRA